MSSAAAVLAALTSFGLFFPLGASGLLVLAWLALALLALLRGRASLHGQGTAWLLAWLGWMLLSASWSPAPWDMVARQGSHAVALLAVPMLAASLTPAMARHLLQVFVAAASLLCLAWAWHAWRPFPSGGLLSSMVFYVGNKSIANATLVALAAALAAQGAVTSEGRARMAWALAGLWMVVMLCWHSQARTAHVALAVGLAALAWWHLRSLKLRVAASLGVLALAAALLGSGGGGLGPRASAGQLDTSSQYRLAVYRETLVMISERPFAGHGLGSWAWLWPARTPRPELREFNTAHNVPLELAAEGGAPALLLLIPVVLAWLGTARRAGLRGAGGPAALVLLAWGTAALFNAALRDPVFATPMIVLLAVALAAAKSDERG